MTEYAIPLTEQEIHDVFVCGAGSIGMYFVYQMSRMGHSVYCCDKRFNSEGHEHEAILMTPRTLEILDSQGIAHRFMSQCVPSRGIKLHLYGKNVSTINVVGDTPFPHMRFLMQGQTTDIFGELLNEQSCTVHWGTELIEYVQFEDHIEVTVRHENGRTEKIRARYIINADGGQIMAVRQLAEAEWICRWYTTTVLCVIVDAVLGGNDLQKLARGYIHFFADNKGVCSIIPFKHAEVDNNGNQVKEAVHRVIMNLDTYHEVKYDQVHSARRLQRSTTAVENARELVPLDELQSILSDRIKTLDLNIAELVEVSACRTSERKVDGFRRNRAFLVGASAYSHALLSAQTMNTGFQDVDNLAWKLSFVLKEMCPYPDNLLESYSMEREPSTVTTLVVIKYLSKLGSKYKGTLGIVAYCLMVITLSCNRMKKVVLKAILQLNVSLPRDSPALCRGIYGPVKAGTYIPETSLLRNRVVKDNESVLEQKTLRQIINHSTVTNPSTAVPVSAHYTLLWICTRPSDCEECPWTNEFWTKLMAANYAPGAVRPIVIESTWHVREFTVPLFADTECFYDKGESFWMEDCFDRYDSITTRISLHSHMFDKPCPPAIMVLVRPDLYITYSFLIHSSSDIDEALNQLSEYVVPAKAEQ